MKWSFRDCWYYGIKVCVPLKFLQWNPNPEGDSIWRWGFGRRSGVGGVMRAGLVSLQEGEGTQDSILSPVMWGHSEKVAIYEPEEGPRQEPGLHMSSEHEDAGCKRCMRGICTESSRGRGTDQKGKLSKNGTFGLIWQNATRDVLAQRYQVNRITSTWKNISYRLSVMVWNLKRPLFLSWLMQWMRPHAVLSWGLRSQEDCRSI